MTEHRLHPPDVAAELASAAWYADRPTAPHIDEAAHRPRLLAAARAVDLVTHLLNAPDRGVRPRVVDVGAGDGGLLAHLRDAHGIGGHGYDLTPANVTVAARRGVRVELVDVVAGAGVEWADIAVATEVLEHLADPHRFVVELRRHCRALVASSPWNESPGNAYAFHLWAWDEAGYRTLLEAAGWEIMAHNTIGPFQVIAALNPDQVDR
jgi:2-polyprenyl-3-methyl-5-hydroxy-6-metoxy-1,4-benzoquinol methylase